MTANCSSSAPQRRAFALSLSNICGRLAALGLRPARDRCCATLDATTRDDLRNTALPAATSDAGLNCGICWGLTFDMRGGRQLAKPDVARPLGGRVSPQLVACTAEKGRLAYAIHGFPVLARGAAPTARPAILPHLYFDALLFISE